MRMKIRIIIVLIGLFVSLSAFAQQAKLIPIQETEDFEVLVADQITKTYEGTFIAILKTYLYSDIAKGSFMETFEVGEIPAYKMEFIEFSPDWSQFAIYAIEAVDDNGNKIFHYTNPSPRTYHPISSSQTVFNLVPMVKKFKIIDYPK